MIEKIVKYSTFAANTQTNDIERAVLPTIMFARKQNKYEGNKVYISSTAISIGWWAWGIGIIRTVTKMIK
jgi:hypothetical protein